MYFFMRALFVGLSTTAITGEGKNITEPQGGGYARATAIYQKTSEGLLWNSTHIVFPPPTGLWGTVRSFFLADAATGENILGYGSLAKIQEFVRGDLVYAEIGELCCRLLTDEINSP